MKNLVIGTCLLLISGWCVASTDMPPFELEPVSDYSANIYLYNAYSNPLFKNMVIAEVKLDGEKTATLRTQSYLLLKVAPGRRVIVTSNQGVTLSHTINAEVGKNYFLKHSLGLDVGTTLMAGVGIYDYHLGAVTEQYAMADLPALKPVKGLAFYVKRQECERSKQHDAPAPVHCQKIIDIKLDENGKAKQYVVDFAGTYEADITSGSNRYFKNVNERHFDIEFTQQGTKLVGVNKDLKMKLIGEVTGSEIEFYALPNRITASEITGSWTIEPDGGLLLGKWNLSGDASGTWNLTRTKLPPPEASNSVATVNLDGTNNIDFSGKYRSEITTSRSRQLGKKYKNMVIELSQSGENLVAREEEFGSTIYLSRDRDEIEFEVRAGRVTGNKTVSGSWKFNPENGNLEGSWNSTNASGKWILKPIE